MEDIIKLLDQATSNPVILLFFSVFGIGYMLKHYTSLNNNCIPWVLLLYGGILGLILIQTSITGLLLGFIIVFIQIGVFESLIKSPLKLFGGKEDKNA